MCRQSRADSRARRRLGAVLSPDDPHGPLFRHLPEDTTHKSMGRQVGGQCHPYRFQVPRELDCTAFTPFGPWRSRSRLIARSQHAACCQSVATTKIHFLRRLPYSDATPGNAVATGAAAESSARRPRGSLRRRVKSPVFPGIPPLSVITIYRCDPRLRAADHRRLDDLQKWLDAPESEASMVFGRYRNLDTRHSGQRGAPIRCRLADDLNQPFPCELYALTFG
jgi:hypothetical protein